MAVTPEVRKMIRDDALDVSPGTTSNEAVLKVLDTLIVEKQASIQFWKNIGREAIVLSEQWRDINTTLESAEKEVNKIRQDCKQIKEERSEIEEDFKRIAKEQKRIRGMLTQLKSDFDEIEKQQAEMHRLLDILEAERYYKGTVWSRVVDELKQRPEALEIERQALAEEDRIIDLECRIAIELPKLITKRLVPLCKRNPGLAQKAIKKILSLCRELKQALQGCIELLKQRAKVGKSGSILHKVSDKKKPDSTSHQSVRLSKSPDALFTPSAREAFLSQPRDQKESVLLEPIKTVKNTR